MARSAKLSVGLWQDETIRRGVFFAAAGALYLTAGYAGLFGEIFVKEHHDRVAMLILGCGLAYFLFGAIQYRAFKVKTRSALLQYRLAVIVARTIGTLLLFASALLAAACAALLLMVTLPPWLFPSRASEFDQILILMRGYFGPVLFVVLLALALTALYELATRSGERTSIRWSRLPISLLEDFPLTHAVGSAFFAVSLAALLAILACSLFAAAAREFAPEFPGLDYVLSVRIGLPVAVLTILCIFAHYRTRSPNLSESHSFAHSAYSVASAMLWIQFAALITAIAALAYHRP